MMKIIGVAIVSVSVLLFGFTYFLKYKQRPEQLELFLNIISIYNSELKWSQKSLFEILSDFKSDKYSDYVTEVKTLYSTGHALSEAFIDNNSVFSGFVLNNHDISVLKYFFEECGKNNLLGEISLCEKTIETLSKRKNDALEEYKKLGPLSLKLSFACGIWAAIMFI